jgi:hypothetical protein
MSNWRAYEQALHPKIWWECTLLQYFKVINPDNIPINLKVISTANHRVVFVMNNKIAQIEINKKIIIETISPELN